MNDLERQLHSIAPKLASEERESLWAGVSFGLSPRRSRKLRRRQIAAVSGAVALVLFSSGVVTVYASGQALPGDVLFPTKLAIEHLRVAIAPSAAQKTQLRVEFAAERLQEVKTLAYTHGVEWNDQDDDGDEATSTLDTMVSATSTIVLPTVTEHDLDHLATSTGIFYRHRATTTSAFKDRTIEKHIDEALRDLRDSKDATTDVPSRQKIEKIERTISRFQGEQRPMLEETSGDTNGTSTSKAIENDTRGNDHSNNERSSSDAQRKLGGNSQELRANVGSSMGRDPSGTPSDVGAGHVDPNRNKEGMRQENGGENSIPGSDR